MAVTAAETAAAPQTFSSTDFRTALGTFPTGVTVITTRSAADAYGLTANAFSSLSLDPPLVLVCVISGTEGSERIQRNGVFAVNILSSEQEPISRYFASRDRPRGQEAFSEVSHGSAVTGSPILDGVAGYLDCRLAAAHEAGDHIIFVGEVMALAVDPERPPLVFHQGRYCFVRDA
jgi:flavin reductase (DIM6/NTAB) family NADH-FMN oxidoreductase RutF